MIDDGCEPVEEVFINTPANAQFLRYFQDGLYFCRILVVYVPTPVGVVGLDAIAEEREEIEIEVVVGIDQPWKNEGAGQGQMYAAEGRWVGVTREIEAGRRIRFAP
jgi:hypothetical protein